MRLQCSKGNCGYKTLCYFRKMGYETFNKRSGEVRPTEIFLINSWHEMFTYGGSSRKMMHYSLPLVSFFL
jgi:hypothetical protein